MQWQNKKMVLLFHIIPLILLAEENILFGTKFLVNTILSWLGTENASNLVVNKYETESMNFSPIICTQELPKI